MWQNAHEAYVETRVLSADRIGLVRLLYQACLAAVRDARRHLAEGEIAARAQAITKAWGILTELTHSLDHQRGGQIAAQLARLYDYMQRRLLEANLQQADEPLAEVLGLLATLAEAWDGIQNQRESPPAQTRWPQAPPQETGIAPSQRLWNF
jgi:flagellar protein FliS